MNTNQTPQPRGTLSRRALLGGSVALPSTAFPGAGQVEPSHPDAGIFALCQDLLPLYDFAQTTDRPTTDPAVHAALETGWRLFAGDLITRRARTIDGARAQVAVWLREFGDEAGAEELAAIFGISRHGL